MENVKKAMVEDMQKITSYIFILLKNIVADLELKKRYTIIN